MIDCSSYLQNPTRRFTFLRAPMDGLTMAETLAVAERVSGVDIMEHLSKLCAEKGYRPYFLRAKQDVVQYVIPRIHNMNSRGIRSIGVRLVYCADRL